MSDLKYTKDGRKVKVVGKINQTEWIVQEIYVTDGGDEVPAGEKFTTKSLLDEPAKTWHERDKAEKEMLAQQAKGRLNRIRDECRDLEKKRKSYYSILGGMASLCKNFKEQDLETFLLVASGTCEYVVMKKWGLPSIRKFDDLIATGESFDSGTKLISLFGKSEGNLSYRINRYSDGSGSSNEIFPCADISSARELAAEFILARLEGGKYNLSFNDLKEIKAMGIELPSDVFDGAVKDIQERMKGSLASSKSTHEKEKKSIEMERKALISFSVNSPPEGSAQ